jgi:hypothetical protein
MNKNLKSALLIMVIVAIGLMLAVSLTLVTTNFGFVRANPYECKYLERVCPLSGWLSERHARSFNIHKGHFIPSRWNQSLSKNVTISSVQAKAVVEAALSNLKIGTIASLRTSWIVPIEDEKGVIALIRVSKINAPTVEHAKNIVEESLKKGWKTGEPRLVRIVYRVPLFDSNNVLITHVKVDGRSGEIIRKPTTMLSITKDQAKAIVSNAIKEFKISEVKERNTLWIVSIEYKDKIVMVIPIEKLNAPNSEGAIKAVQESLRNGWSAGEPKEFQSIYNVPIIDAYNNTIGSVKVDGRTGDIIAGIHDTFLFKLGQCDYFA